MWEPEGQSRAKKRSRGGAARRWVSAGSLLLLSAAGCMTVQTTSPGAIGVRRPQQMSPLISEAELQAGAKQAYQKLTSEAAARGKLNANRAALGQVRGVSQRLIAQTHVFRPDAARWSWEINLIDSPEVNAWCMPGGKIAIYTGFLQKIQPTEAELAAVIGHEIAHALREHARERASRAVTQGVLLEIAGAAAGAPAGTIDFAKLALEVTTNLPNSREQEDEADRIGVELAARAGYDPRAAVTLWRKMLAQGGKAPPEFLSTHPSAASRIQSVGRYSNQVLHLYQPRR
jgi:predicted Zn-dependent protease